MFKKILFATLIFGLVLFAFSCKDEDDSNPPAGPDKQVSGKVIFHGEWPDSGTVQLSIFTNWDTTGCNFCPAAAGGPPAYYTAANYFQNPDPQNLSDTDTLAFTLEGVEYGTYRSVALGWRAPHVSDIACDEPVIGLYGATPGSNDSIPLAITLDGSNRSIDTVLIHAYFNRLPVPGCDSLGRISGTARITGAWPGGGLLVMLTAQPVTAWFPVTQQPVGYYIMPTPADTVFRFTPRLGTYYLSIWSNTAPPAPSLWYGSYAVNNSTGDARPDAITLTDNSPDLGGFIVRGSSPAPHWISGGITFNGTRPAEGLLVLVTTTPGIPPDVAPSAYFPITDPNENFYAISGLPDGTYYVYLYTNTPPPAPPTFYAAWGYGGSDTNPDGVILSSANYGYNNINLNWP